MVEVTSKYREAMDNHVRAGAYARVEFDIIDPGAAADITARSDNGHLFYSTLDGIEFDRVPEQTYATFEPGRWLCDGSQLVPDEVHPVEQGYIGQHISNGAGVFETRPTLHIDFGNPRTFRALTLTFDPSCGGYPAHIRAVGYLDGAATITVDGHPDGPVYELIPERRERFKNINRLEIIFLESSGPYQRARLQRILFGYVKSVDSFSTPMDGMLEGITCSAESDPLCREIPRQDATVSIIDHEGIYAIDNPTGIWPDIEERIPMRIFIGAKIPAGLTWGEAFQNYTWAEMNRKTWREVHSGGYYETFLHGSYWLDSQPVTNGLNAQFTGVSVVDLLDFEFRRWPANGGTLYDLATLVLESIELPRQSDGRALWHLWEGLKAIHTAAPMGIKTCREILQDIAVAGCCTMYFDRLGALHMEPLPDTQYDFTLDFDNRQVALPSGEKIPALGGVTVSTYRYTPAEAKQLHGESYTVAAGETIEVELSSPAVNVKVSAGSGRAEIYSSAVYVSFDTAGAYTVTVEGCEVEESAAVVSLPVDGAAPAAAWAVLDNRLVTSAERARACGEWYRDYLLKRLTYTVRSVGFPEVDVYDKIYTESRFTGRLPGHVVGHSLRYNGALWSDFTVKVDGEI